MRYSATLWGKNSHELETNHRSDVLFVDFIAVYIQRIKWIFVKPMCFFFLHGMIRSQVADGEGGLLQMWRVAANILNEQFGADQGRSSIL